MLFGQDEMDAITGVFKDLDSVVSLKVDIFRKLNRGRELVKTIRNRFPSLYVFRRDERFSRHLGFLINKAILNKALLIKSLNRILGMSPWSLNSRSIAESKLTFLDFYTISAHGIFVSIVSKAGSECGSSVRGSARDWKPD
jgi:hypothetical protein